MSRPRAGNAAVNVSLFPFLAVLICTMGALILVLVVIAKQTQQSAAAARAHNEASSREEAAQLANTAKKLAQEYEGLLDKLAQQRDANAALETELSAADAERNRLSAQLAANGADDDSSDADRRAALLAEISKLDRDISRSRHERDRLRGVADRGSKSFAVVPYQGQYGTRRRPIYIECTANKVILQPEGITIDPVDLETPFGKTNPLSRAVEAASEHLLRLQRSDAGQPGIPYPLLLVRPEGIENFYLARHALQASANEFGYELIESDWQLDYPEVDENLALVMSDAVKEARQAQLHLARMAPRLRRRSRHFGGTDSNGTGDDGYGQGGSGDDNGSGNGSGTGSGTGDGDGGPYPESSYGNSIGGSSTAAGALGANSLASSGTTSAMGAMGRATGNTAGLGGTPAFPPGASLNPTPVGNGYGTGNGGTPASGGGTGSGTGQTSDAFSFDNAPSGGGPGTPSFDDPATSASAGGSGGAPGPQLLASGAPGGAGSNAGGGTSGGQSSGAPSSALTSTGGTSSGGTSSGAASSATSPLAGSFSADMAPGGASNSAASSGIGIASLGGAPGTAAPGAGAPGAGAPGTAGGGAASRSSGRRAAGSHGGNGSSSSGQMRGTDNRDMQPGNVGAGSDSHGNGKQPWALDNASSSAVPVTRPIRVRIGAERFAMMTPDGRHERRVVSFTDNTSDVVSDVVSAVWDQTEAWGLAGRGLYWSPILVAEVSPDGQQRFEQLQRLLAGSGIQLKQRSPAKSAAQTSGRKTTSR